MEDFMTNKDKGQFIIEIKNISLQKEFQGLVLKKLNPFNLIKKVDEILETRKDAYNYQFVKCCEVNGISNIDNIHSDLEKLWTESKKEFDLLKDGLPNLFLLLRSGFATILNVLSTYQDRITIKWTQYIKKTIEYAKTLDDLENGIEAK
jgi:hypothetical protein